MRSRTITVNDTMQRGYCYKRIEPVGQNFDEGFEPELAPPGLLELGVFGGKYMTDCREEFPASWFRKAKLSPRLHAPRSRVPAPSAASPAALGIRQPKRSDRHAAPRTQLAHATIITRQV
jgi:hypothetical protein